MFILSLSANDNTLPITNVGKLNTFTNSKYLFIAIHIFSLSWIILHW